MRAGDMAQGSAVLRAKIDMSHPNVIMPRGLWTSNHPENELFEPRRLVEMAFSSAPSPSFWPRTLPRRDPIMYRILPNTPHPRTGDEALCFAVVWEALEVRGHLTA